MRYLYPFAPRPEASLAMSLEAAAERMAGKFSSLDIAGLPVSDYTKRYMGIMAKSVRRIMQRYVRLLALSLAGRDRWDDVVFIDYGAGPGVLGFLAKELGVGTVVYNDIYDVSCRAAQVVGEELGTETDLTICGDIGDVIAQLRGRGISCDVVASWDVLEHIYDPISFLGRLPELSDGPMRVVMGSTANAANPIARRRLCRAQYAVENTDRSPEWGHKERDSLKAYVTLRREMAAKHAPHLSDQQLDQLAEATRGLAGEDILKATDRYVAEGILPRPAHPSNTCDPLTGNWCEQLLDPDELAQALEEGGFSARVLPTYYGHYGRPFTDAMGTLLNAGIRFLGRLDLTLALGYILVANRS